MPDRLRTLYIIEPIYKHLNFFSGIMNRLNDSVVSLAEFHAPSPMQKFYCRKVTRDEYEYQMVNETEKAIHVSEYNCTKKKHR